MMMVSGKNMINWFTNLFYGSYERRVKDLLDKQTILIDENAFLKESNEKITKSNALLSSKILNQNAEIKSLNDEINLLSQSQIIEAKSYGKITLQEADAYFQKLGISDIHLSDVQYDLTTVSEAKKFCGETKVQLRKWEQETHDCPIHPETSWAHGLFFTDGTCGIDKNGVAFWKISNTNLSFLERAKQAYEAEWPGFSFIMKTYPSQLKGTKTNFGTRNYTLYELQMQPRVRKGTYGLRKELITIFKNTFYTKGYKKVPGPMWEQKREIKIKFLEGVIAGDGNKTCSRITIRGKFGLFGLIDCMRDCNWKYSISKDNRHEEIFMIGFDRRNEYIPMIADYVEMNKSVTLQQIKEKFNHRDIQRAIKMLVSEGYILLQYKKPENKQYGYVESLKAYPIACDNFSFALMGYWSQGLMSFAFGIAWSNNHAFNIMFSEDKTLYVCEPQTNTWTKYSDAKKDSKYKIVSVMM